MFEVTHSYDGSSLQRWLTGHHLFFVEIQAIILAVDLYVREPNDANLRHVIALLRGSATSMQFAADFSPAAYEPVRQSMAHLDPEFSGLFSADHRVMMQRLKKLKETVARHPSDFRDLKDAISIAYNAHAHVCRRVVGDGGSLANKDGTAWRTILTTLLPLALERIGIRRTNARAKESHDAKHLH
jgi:hypothetical protein